MAAEASPISCDVSGHDFREKAIGSYLKYLSTTSKAGHSRDGADYLEVFSFGFGEENFREFEGIEDLDDAIGLEFQMAENADEAVRQLKNKALSDALKKMTADFKAAKDSKLIPKNRVIDARLIRADLSHRAALYEDAYKILKRIYQHSGKLPLVGVVHEKKKNGEKFWHLHAVMATHEPGTMKQFDRELNRNFASDLRSIIAQVYSEREIEVRQSRYANASPEDRRDIHAYYKVVPKLAHLIARMKGEKNIRDATTKMLKSPGFNQKVAENLLPEIEVKSNRARRGAKKRSEHAMINHLKRSSKTKTESVENLDTSMKLFSGTFKKKTVEAPPVVSEGKKPTEKVDVPIIQVSVPTVETPSQQMEVVKVELKAKDPDRVKRLMAEAAVRKEAKLATKNETAPVASSNQVPASQRPAGSGSGVKDTGIKGVGPRISLRSSSKSLGGASSSSQVTPSIGVKKSSGKTK